MTSPQRPLRELLDIMNRRYDQVVAFYFDAKMRTSQFPGTQFLLNVPPPPGRPSDTIEQCEPFISERNPEWIKNPDKIPARLRNARMKRSPEADRELLTSDPRVIAVDYARLTDLVTQRIARLLQRTELEIALAQDNNPTVRRRARAQLLEDSEISAALAAETAQSDQQRRTAAEALLKREVRQQPDRRHVTERNAPEPGTSLE